MATPTTQIPAETLNRMQPYEPPQSAGGFGSFLRSLTVKLAAEDMMVNRSENRRAALVQNFYRGNQRGTISPFDYSFLPVAAKNRSDPRLIHNWFRPMSRAITGQWTLARTDVIVLPLPTDSHDVHIAGAARYATRLAERLQSLIMTETWRQTRAKYAQFSGLNAFYSYWDMNGCIDAFGSRYQPMATKPVTEMREQAISQGGYACNSCGYGGSLEEANEGCPACGGQDLSVEQPFSAQMPVVSGYEHQPLGFLCSRQVPRWQLKWDRMAATLAESSYLLWEFPMRDEVIREAFPFWRAQSSVEQPDDRGSIRTEYELRNQPGNVPSWGTPARSPRTGQSIVRNWWLSPCWYREAKMGDFKLTVGMENGQPQYETFNPQMPAIEKYPTGCFVTMVGMDVLGLVDEEKLDHWLISSYDLIPGQIGGDGIEDGIPAQRHINKVKALKDANLENCAGAGALYNPLFINREDVPSSPFDIAPVKQGFPVGVPGVSLKTDVVAHIERPALAGDALVQDTESIQEMLFQFGTGPGVAAPPEAGLNESGTATEAMIQSQGAKSQRSPELALASEADCALITQWLRLFQKHAGDDIAIPMKGENGEFEWEWFKGAQIPANFLVTTRTRGSAPKSDEDLQADFKSAWSMVGGPQGLVLLAQQFPQLVEQVEERWGVDFKLNNLGRIATLVRYRLDVMTAELQKYAQSGIDPQMLAPSIAEDPRVMPDVEEPHELFTGKWREWLLSDEAQKARTENPAKIIAVHAMIDLHKQGGIVQAQEQQEQQIAAQAPAMRMQQEQMSQQQAQEQSGQSQQQAAQATEAQAQRDHETGMAQSKQAGDERLMQLRNNVQEKRQTAGRKEK